MKSDVRLEDRSQGVLAGARAGQEWAWAAIYRDLAPPLLGYLRARGAAEPEDTLGESFLQMVRDIEHFTGSERDLRAWAFAIARNRLVDDRRYRARRPIELAPPEALAGAAAPDPAETWTPSLGGEQITAALRRLPERQRDVVLLRVLGDLTVDEVARVIGKTPGAVKAIQHRALSTLRREVSQSTVTLSGRWTLTKTRCAVTRSSATGTSGKCSKVARTAVQATMPQNCSPVSRPPAFSLPARRSRPLISRRSWPRRLPSASPRTPSSSPRAVRID